MLVVLRTENPRAIIRFKFFCRVRPEFNLILDTLDILLLLSYKQPSKRGGNAKDLIVRRLAATSPDDEPIHGLLHWHARDQI